MQPICVFRSDTAGLVYLNGRFAGEIGGNVRLSAPVSPQGALIIEFRPTIPGVLPMATRIAFSSGKPVAESLAKETRLKAVYWPCGALDMDLFPETLSGEEAAEVSAPEWSPEGACAAAIRAADAVREGARYPGLIDEETEKALRNADAVVPIPYAMPSGEAAIGLASVLSPAYATVAPLYYSTDGEGRLLRMWL